MRLLEQFRVDARFMSHTLVIVRRRGWMGRREVPLDLVRQTFFGSSQPVGHALHNNTIMGQKSPGPALARRAVVFQRLRVPARRHGQPDVLLLVGPVGRHVLGLVVDLRGKQPVTPSSRRSHGLVVASMARKLHAIEQAQLGTQRRVDGVEARRHRCGAP